MANYTVPAQHGGQIPLQTQDRDHLFTLDVLWANKYENETISPTDAMKMEFEFYKGAPPQWLNFYWAEHENSPLVRRDLYEKLQTEIKKTRRQRGSIAQINLLHDPGSGGSTLAMQVLWDWRKKLRCAKLIDSTMDTRTIAKQVLRLFAANGLEKQNTVLLLLDINEDASFQEQLNGNLCDEIKANNITATIPVVIILNCQKKQTERTFVKLSSKLSEAEKDGFKRKQSAISQTYGNSHTKLHAFNIMLSDYDKSYITEVCRNLQPLKNKRRPRKEQLLAFLALVNSYVPGSDLPYGFCQRFLKREGNNLDHFSLEEHMQPFTDFLVMFSTKEEKANCEAMHVRMVHPMIARECLQLLTDTGVTRSDTTLKLMEELGIDDMPQSLEKTIKRLLTKREDRDDISTKSKMNKFSRLILDIKTEEQKSICVAVLKIALNKFRTNPFIPQALARFCYIEMNNYGSAKYWAEMAIMRDERNSFIRDTLGQVHKNQLRNVICKEEKHEGYAGQILHHGKKATEAFETEEKVAMKEGTPEMQEDGITTISTFFNNRGIFGYIQVAKIIFDHITPLHSVWSSVLSEENSMQDFLNSSEIAKCKKYEDFITSLRKNVEFKFEFFEWYLLYSKPSINKDEPEYFRPEINECYTKFVSQSQQNKSALQILKEQKASTFAGLLNKQAQNTELELITEQWEEIYLHSQSDPQNILNYIAANVMLSQRNDASAALRPLEELQEMLQKLWTEQKDKRSPEFYLFVLLLFWPDAQDNRPNSLTISECVRYMHHSFETTYKHYLRSRYLVPLFFLSERRGLQRFIHKSCLDPTSIDDLMKRGRDVENTQLRRVKGEVKNYKIFATEGSEKIEVSADHPASVHGSGKVSFYLSLKISGPVAYNIKYEQ